MSNTIIFVSKGEDYFPKLLSFLESSKSDVCFVTLNKTFGSLRDAFGDSGIALNRFHFIDGVSMRLFSPKKLSSCDFFLIFQILNFLINSYKNMLPKDILLLL
jgi:hypothetical protein